MPSENERHYCYWRRCTSRGPYADSKTLFEHIEDAHNIQPSKGEPFYCKWEDCRCKRAISGKKHRTDHLITHARYKPLVCTATGCSATFSTSHSMNAHLLTRHAASASKSPSKSPASKRKRAGSGGGKKAPIAKRRRLADGNEAASESDGDTATSTRAATYATSSDESVAERTSLQLRRRVQAAEENMKRMQTQLDVLLNERAPRPSNVQQQIPTGRRSVGVALERDAAPGHTVPEVQVKEEWEVDASDARSGCVIA